MKFIFVIGLLNLLKVIFVFFISFQTFIFLLLNNITAQQSYYFALTINCNEMNI